MARKSRVSFEATGKSIPNVETPITDDYATFEQRGAFRGDPPCVAAREPLTAPGSLDLDGYEAARNIGFEVVTEKDLDAWSEYGGQANGPVQDPQ